MKQETIEAAVAASAPKIMYGGAGLMTWGGLSLNDWMAVGGFVIGLIGYLTNLYFKHKHFKLAQLETEAKMADRGFYEQG